MTRQRPQTGKTTTQKKKQDRAKMPSIGGVTSGEIHRLLDKAAQPVEKTEPDRA